ncbi:T-complex protein 11 X-linked protein 1 [Octopus bimaculoides]|uniref:T-complex protein 11 X-linked protein 1 n=1 Tax=Octopus bimaculoides TaxID=37653 RepID=UPI00071D8E2B|nr:T-complex protein 11 X-linked protein 1 [Octopus bimaculoides]XP_014775945.1 T-complex protein 11 X-linked protein 1 [Octopus bimaculoides]|eukprot:XP_014775944.1 PREDICTED: T-complex protein 11 X-linked protein 1-like [Octopus bimaculoides]
MSDTPNESKEKESTLEMNSSQSESKSFKRMMPDEPFLLHLSSEKSTEIYNCFRDMELLHEIVINEKYELERPQPPENSFYKRIHTIFHNLFWNQIDEQLNATPPDYKSAIQIIETIREMILELMLPWQQKLQQQFCEVLDMELIKQKIERGAFDLHYYEDYIITMMEKICAPVRDEDVAKLRQIHEVVPLFRAIVNTLELMKLDLANFTIKQARPYMQHHYISLEQRKFKKLIEHSNENGHDLLKRTKMWLQRNDDKLSRLAQLNSEDNGACAAANSCSGTFIPSLDGPPTSTNILNMAYLELVNWEDLQLYPETMFLDERRYRSLQKEFHLLALISAMLLVTYNTIGSSITGVTELRDQLKKCLFILLEKSYSEHEQNPSDIAIRCAEQVNSVVNDWLRNHDFAELTLEKQKLLLGQLQEVVSPQHAVHKVMLKRINEFIYQCICCGCVDKVKVPAGVSAVETELTAATKVFIRLIGLNFGVCREFYTELLSAMIQSKDEAASEPKDTSERPKSPDNS